MAQKERTPIDVLRDLVDMARTPATLMTLGRFERWHNLIHEAEAMVQGRPPDVPTIGDIFGGIK
jgi:hypothetical protein